MHSRCFVTARISCLVADLTPLGTVSASTVRAIVFLAEHFYTTCSCCDLSKVKVTFLQCQDPQHGGSAQESMGQI
jgi:hypothetical protein